MQRQAQPFDFTGSSCFRATDPENHNSVLSAFERLSLSERTSLPAGTKPLLQIFALTRCPEAAYSNFRNSSTVSPASLTIPPIVYALTDMMMCLPCRIIRNPHLGALFASKFRRNDDVFRDIQTNTLANLGRRR